MDPPHIRIDAISKSYGTHRAVENFSLAIARGELVSLLGPSGCGKTTMLRMLAGFIAPNAGRIAIAEKDVTHLPAHKRDTGMVFQSYALFPHMTVAENLAFGLRRRRVAASERKRRVEDTIEMLRLNGLAKRLPRELSGGQQQRVAVGRALIVRPAVLLLDEPFSNLDAKLRDGTRVEIRRLQRELRLTTVFVTHDQKEALSVSDRVAVMSDGRLEQVGTPQEIYERPGSTFVADFLGSANLLEMTVDAVERTGQARLRATHGGVLPLPADPTWRPGARVWIAVRRERIAITPGGDAEAQWPGRVRDVLFCGDTAEVIVAMSDDSAIVASVASEKAAELTSGMAVGVGISANDAIPCAGDREHAP